MYGSTMQGNAEVIELLNEVLTGELTAINQYFIHAKMCGNWGFHRLEEKVRDESIEEMKHAEALIERVLFLEGVPNLQRLGNITTGETVPEQFSLDLQLEMTALDLLKRAIAKSLEVADSGSRELFEHILVNEEQHIDWLETQQEAIAQTGLENYLAEQLHS
jgi:bacterioferritin